MKDFEKSKMLLTVLKKIESSIYEKKEHGLEDMSKLLHEQNELM